MFRARGWASSRSRRLVSGRRRGSWPVPVGRPPVLVGRTQKNAGTTLPRRCACNARNSRLPFGSRGTPHAHPEYLDSPWRVEALMTRVPVAARKMGAPSLARSCFCAKGGKPQPSPCLVHPERRREAIDPALLRRRCRGASAAGDSTAGAGCRPGRPRRGVCRRFAREPRCRRGPAAS